MSEPPSPAPPGPKEARRARQAEALRRNLARRKQQARERAAQADSPSPDRSDDAPAGDEG